MYDPSPLKYVDNYYHVVRDSTARIGVYKSYATPLINRPLYIIALRGSLQNSHKDKEDDDKVYRGELDNISLTSEVESLFGSSVSMNFMVAGYSLGGTVAAILTRHYPHVKGLGFNIGAPPSCPILDVQGFTHYHVIVSITRRVIIGRYQEYVLPW